jgi:nitrite reductase/ring-hydroxylating ferredoxin subunit
MTSESNPVALRRVDLLGLDEVPEGTMKMGYVDGTEQVIVVHTGGEIRAFQGICTHEYFELDKGFLTGGGSPGENGRPAGTLTCALHLSRFDLADGEALDPPAELPLMRYPVVIEGDRVLIEIPEGALPVNE